MSAKRFAAAPHRLPIVSTLRPKLAALSNELFSSSAWVAMPPPPVTRPHPSPGYAFLNTAGPTPRLHGVPWNTGRGTQDLVRRPDRPNGLRSSRTAAARRCRLTRLRWILRRQGGDRGRVAVDHGCHSDSKDSSRGNAAVVQGHRHGDRRRRTLRRDNRHERLRGRRRRASHGCARRAGSGRSRRRCRACRGATRAGRPRGAAATGFRRVVERLA